MGKMMEALERKTLKICDELYDIRFTKGAILDVLSLLDGKYVDGTYEERIDAALYIFYSDYDKMPRDLRNEALEKMIDFLAEELA